MKMIEVQCEVLDRDQLYSVTEVCRLCGATEPLIRAMVQEGIVEWAPAQGDERRVDGFGLRRIRVAVRLQRDLGVNLPGAALALELLEELEELRRRR